MRHCLGLVPDIAASQQGRASTLSLARATASLLKAVPGSMYMVKPCRSISRQESCVAMCSSSDVTPAFQSAKETVAVDGVERSRMPRHVVWTIRLCASMKAGMNRATARVECAPWPPSAPYLGRRPNRGDPLAGVGSTIRQVSSTLSSRANNAAWPSIASDSSRSYASMRSRPNTSS